MQSGSGSSQIRAGSDALLEAALGSMPYAFCVWDEQYRLVLYNRRYLEMFGYPAESVRVGMHARDLAALNFRLGTYPGFTAEELFATFVQRLKGIDDGRKAVRSQSTVRDRIIKNTFSRIPGTGWIITNEDVTAEVELSGLSAARETDLAAQNQLFSAALDNMPSGLSMYDADWRLVVRNDRYLELYGIPPEVAHKGAAFKDIMAHRHASGAVPIDLDTGLAEAARGAAHHDEARVHAYRLSDGRVVSVTQTPMPAGGFVATHQDVTLDIARLEALKLNQDALAQQNLRFDAAVNTMSQGLCMFGADERLVVCNAAYAKIYNLPPELMRPGTSLGEILDFRFEHGMVPLGGRESYVYGRRALVTNRVFAKDVIELADGRCIAIQHHPMADGGWVATHEDITEQRQNEARIRHLARHDALTKLPNRILFREEMDDAEARIRRNEILAVLCVDLDHFKSVNDVLGHAVGDGVLVEVAARLKTASRETDVVARLGGDEFAILVNQLDGARDAAAIAARIVKSLAEPMLIDGQHVAIGASVGIAVAPSDGFSGETLLKNADLALYRAKSDGRGTYHFFEKGMDEALQHRRELEQGLRVGLAREEFRLVFQPLIELEGNRICCLEALLRWDHPDHGVIAPREFIPIAEETGMIVPIGEWVLREACKAAATWPEEVRVAVNLSPIQFKNRALVTQVTAALNEAGLDPRRLELEITESLLLADTALTLETLHRLRALGVRIAMDDFGTGYSSLSYLRAFPFDKIKIDRTFMSDFDETADSMAIIKAVIGLGRSLGMTTTAEGVETEDQLRAVREQGCSEVQGFLFSPPLPASSIASLLQSSGQQTPIRAKLPAARKRA